MVVTHIIKKNTWVERNDTHTHTQNSNNVITRRRSINRVRSYVFCSRARVKQMQKQNRGRSWKKKTCLCKKKWQPYYKLFVSVRPVDLEIKRTSIKKQRSSNLITQHHLSMSLRRVAKGNEVYQALRRWRNSKPFL